MLLFYPKKLLADLFNFGVKVGFMMTILISYFPFKCVHRGTEVLIVSFNAIQDIMEQAVSRRVNVQWTCVILCLAVKSPAQQVSQYFSAFHFPFQTKNH